MKKISYLILITLASMACNIIEEDPIPKGKYYFYRLNQIDYNGQEEMHQVVKANARTLADRYREVQNLTIDSKLSIDDTLVVMGNFLAEKGSSIVLNKGGLLIVVGDLITKSSHTSFLNHGNIYVGGLFNPIGNKFDNKGSIYACHIKNGNSINGTIIESCNIMWRSYAMTCTGLPITIKSFTVKKRIDGNLIAFETSTESNSDRVEIERSEDGVSGWKTITSIKSNNVSSKYSYLDKI